MRQRMRSAPFYESDTPQTADFLATNEYGVFPANGHMPGQVITEIHVPEVRLVDKENREEQNWSKTSERFHEAYAFDGCMSSVLGDALSNLGFKSTIIPTDERGSKMLIIEYPSAEQLTANLAKSGDETINFVPVAEKTPSTLATTEALARGDMLVSDEPSVQAGTLLYHASIWALLPPEMTQILTRKAAFILNPGNRIGDAPEQTEEIPEEVNRFAYSLYRISPYGFSTALTNAVRCAKEEYFPSPIDDLGNALHDFVKTEEAKLPDSGRALAENTLAHIKNLSNK